MRSVFVGSGLFEWLGMSFLAEPDDPYLSEVNHVAICQTQYPDVLSEFSWEDNGAYGNQRGNQSGWEASVHSYYDYPWDDILYFIGDGDVVPSVPSGGSGSEAGGVSAELPMPRIAVMMDGKETWLGWHTGLECEDGDSDDFADIEGMPIVDIQVDESSLGSGG